MTNLTANQIENLSTFCVAKASAGGNLISGSWNDVTDNCSTVTYDQKTYYYDIKDVAPTANEFQIFVESAWGVDDVKVIIWDEGVYKVTID